MPQVLLVEDDTAIRVALTRSLHDQGHVVRSAASGMTALSDAVLAPTVGDSHAARRAVALCPALALRLERSA